MSKVYGQPLLDDMARSQSLPMPLVKQAAREILEVIREGLIRDKVVKVSNFGTFRLKPVAARRGINPQTGESITIPARHRVIFTPCKALRDLIQPIHRPPVPTESARPVSDDAHTQTAKATTLSAQSEARQSGRQATASVPHIDASLAPSVQPDPRPETTEQPEPQASAPERLVTIDTQPTSKQNSESERKPVEPRTPKPQEAVSKSLAMQAEDRQDESIRQGSDIALENRARSEQQTVSAQTETHPGDITSSARNYRFLAAALIIVIAVIGVGLLMNEVPPMDEPAATDMIAINPEENSPVPGTSNSGVTAEQPAAEIEDEPVPADIQDRVNATAKNAAPTRTDRAVPTRTATEMAGSAPASTNKTAESATASGTSDSARPAEDFFRERTHTIANGESLWRLAGNHYHDPLLWPHIYQANTAIIDNPDYLLVGRTITLPGLQGSPEELTRNDRRNIAEGYYLAYLYYKKTGREDALFALLEAKRYDKELVEEQRGQIKLTRTEELKLAQQVPMPD
ncbi:MAG: HU family DNA-binding protein [Pseudomonadota bacterium]